jgi:glycine/D-amino acid oxidase-like deaminating enzyme
MPPKFDLAIIGGGICGLSHAAAAASKGLSVVVFERNARCIDASARNFGLLTQLYDDGARNGQLAARSRKLYESWAQSGGLPFKRTSSLQLAQSEKQLSLLRAFSKAVETKGVMKCELVDAKDAQRLVPALSILSPPHGTPSNGEILGALCIHDDALIEPRILTASLPAFLSSPDSSSVLNAIESRSGTPFKPVTMRFLETVHTISQDGDNSSTLRLSTSRGNVAFASHVAVCSGADIASLLPHVFSQHSSSLRLCKLQMMRIGLPRSLQNPALRETLPIPVTSGLTLRRYPAFSAFAPQEREEMMNAEKDEIADSLGIHIIARPSAKLPRTTFGNVVFGSSLNGMSDVMKQEMDESEIILGDSHQYSPIPRINSEVEKNGDALNKINDVFDEASDELVTNEILRVAGTMLKGINGLYLQRTSGGEEVNARNELIEGEVARLLSQWTGVYLQHSNGLLNVDYKSNICGAKNGDALSHQIWGNDASKGGTVHVVTGLGGAGMTLSPALGEENVNTWFK